MHSPLISSFTFRPQKTILFAWELGGGLGHMMPMLPLAEDLAQAGHCVYVAMRNLGGAAAIYGKAGVRFLPAALPRVRYWGHVSGSGGIAPQWPQGSGKRIYAYLKRSAAIEEILEELARRQQPTLVYAMGIEPAVRQRFESTSMRFETRPLDMSAVARECDLAVLNANHGTLCDLLLAGKPLLMLPLHLEQRVLAERVSGLGVGPWMTPRRGRGARAAAARGGGGGAGGGTLRAGVN
jgi:UDP:flavonoid glycosyltransferase YjiC (YdhE family)